MIRSLPDLSRESEQMDGWTGGPCVMPACPPTARQAGSREETWSY